MDHFSQLTAQIRFRIEHGRNYPIHVWLNSVPSQESVDERKLVVNCDIQGLNNVRNPNRIHALLFEPQASITDPLILSPNTIPALPATIDGHYINNQEKITGTDSTWPARDQSALWQYWISRYWQQVPGVDVEMTAADFAAERQGAAWPGERRSHQFSPCSVGFCNDDDLVPAEAWGPYRLRLATTLDRPVKRLMVLVEIHRKKRLQQAVFTFTVRGNVTGQQRVDLDWMPIAIVYCPPGQDMTNSLVESYSHGTRVSFGQSFTRLDERFYSVGVQGGFSIGPVGVEVEMETSGSLTDSVTDSSQTTLVFRKTQETMITANNQRAIGRAYWGTLGDLFVILESPAFAVADVFINRPDEGVVSLSAIGPYPSSPRTRKLVIPAYLLLRPELDPMAVASRLPWEVRRRMLLLDPFIVQDTSVLDDVSSGVRPIDDAVDPAADPNGAGNPTRGTPVTQLGLAAGTEINYYEATSISLETVTSHLQEYTTTVTNVEEASGSFLGSGARFSEGDTLTIRYLTTSELVQESSATKTAKCYLIRNQNDAGFGAIDVYYDTIFGTFMFRNHWIHTTPFDPGGPYKVDVVGMVRGGPNLSGLPHTEVTIGGRGLGSGPREAFRTATNSAGYYRFSGLGAGEYEITVAGQSVNLTIREEDVMKRRTMRADVRNAKRTLDLAKARIIDIMDAFGVSPAAARAFGRSVSTFRSEQDVFKFFKMSQDAVKRFHTRYVLVLPKTQETRSRG